MNFLAHAYLSFGNPELITGNLISDFVKGRKKFDYPPLILAGIDLHRAIDNYTDSHPLTREAARVFKPAYGLYGSAFIDIVYDHFLALELAEKDRQGFEDFTAEVYRAVDTFDPILPPAFRSIFPYMKQQNWLFNYQFIWGMENSFEGLVRRAAYLSDSRPALQLLTDHYVELRSAFREFFPQLRSFSLEKFSDIH